MSIILGKRSVCDNTFEEFSNTFQNQFSMQYKRVRNYEISNENSSPLQQTQESMKHLQCNLNYLKQKYPNIKESELVNFLDLCDNNLNLVIELINKAQNMLLLKEYKIPNSNHNETSNYENEHQKNIIEHDDNTNNNNKDRHIKKILSIREQIGMSAPEKQQQIQHEQIQQPTIDQQLDHQIIKFTNMLIPSLQKANNLQDAQAMINQGLKLFSDEIKKQSKLESQKCLDENSLLKKAFLKLNQKTKALTEKNEELKRNLEYYQEEIQKEKFLNYKLNLKLRQMVNSEEDLINHDVY